MKKWLVVVYILLFVVVAFGCSKNSNITENSDLSVSLTPRWFKSGEQFISAIKEEKAVNENQENNDIELQHSIDEIEFYFVPQEIPKGAYLELISVKDLYICLRYVYDDEPDPNWERLFLFEWYRTRGEGDIEKTVSNQSDDKNMRQYKNYYVQLIEPWGEYKTSNDYVCQNIFWEQDGYAFHAVVPIGFTDEDIERYCIAKKINIS